MTQAETCGYLINPRYLPVAALKPPALLSFYDTPG
jgi:hypothetical protein